MKSLIENYINGNLTDARRQARRYSLHAIFRKLREDYGFSEHKAVMTAYFLKNQCTFQQACDAI